MNYNLRRADKSDCKTLFEWANDSKVRCAAFNSSLIKWEDHKIWFETKFRNSNSMIYILEISGESIGQIRFDSEGDKAFLIDFSISNQFRGRSLGTLIVKSGIEQLIKDFGLPLKFIGHVKVDNYPSLRAFEKNNFLLVAENRDFISYEKDFQ